MSIYDNEGAPDLRSIGNAIVDDLTNSGFYVDGEVIKVYHDVHRVCTITPSVPFEVLVAGGGNHIYCSALSDILARVRELAEAAWEKQLGLVIKDCVGIPGTVEEAPAEPTLREFLVEFRRWTKGEGDYEVGGCVADHRLAKWIDARLGKEKSDG